MLNKIINEMIDVVENSKDEIFNISEEAREDHDELKQVLEQIKENVLTHIKTGDVLEQKLKNSRQKLSIVSKDFESYSEEAVREVYEETYKLQVDLEMLRKEEKLLRDRRDYIERRLITLSQTVERATGLANKISVILSYLYGEFSHMNEMIEDAKEKQTFGLKVIEAQEEERKKISREIHDGPAQMLANILLRSELINRSYEKGQTEQAIEELQSVRGMIRSSLYEVRRIIYDLRPMALDDLGLIPTMRKYTDKIADYNNIDVQFIPLGKKERLQQRYEIALFRLMQESIQNAIKHADPSVIKVKIEINKHYILLNIQDNGKGFDIEEKQKSSFGLIGMRERVEMLEGDFKIESDIGAGTKVFIKIPHKQA